MSVAVIVGILSGLAALALNRSLETIFEWIHPWRRYWWALFIPGIGAALSSLYLEKIMHEGNGHGVPEVINSVSRHGGVLRFRSSFSQLIASCLTISSGGSAGPEAPVVTSGSAIGSNIARLFSLNDRQRVTLVGCGAAGAIGSIFNAPLAGMVFSIEVILGEWTTVNIIPIAIAAVSGTEISRMLHGNQIAFAHHGFEIGILDIGATLGLALCCTAASILLTRLMRHTQYFVGRIAWPHSIQAAIGGFVVGLIGLGLPVILGEGYHTIRTVINSEFEPGILLVIGIALAKIIGTTFTLGWGGSGGIFAPCLFIGSFVGLAYHRCLAALWPDVAWVNEGCFGLLGMAGMISGILQAPLTGIFLIVEITGGYSVILPLIMVSAISTSICHYFEYASFYLRDLVDKGQLLRLGTDARVLSDLSVVEVIETDCIPVHQDMLLKEFIKVVQKSHRNYFPVTEKESGNFIGMIHLDDIREYLFNPIMYTAVVIGQIMDTDIKTVAPGDDLNDVLKIMDENHIFSLPVVAENRFLGMISKATLLDQYRKELMVQTY